MKRSEIKDLRAMKSADLRKRAEEIQDELFRMRMESASEDKPLPVKARKLRRDIARLNTIIKEKAAEVQA